MNSSNTQPIQQPDWLHPDKIPISAEDVQYHYDQISDRYDTFTQAANYQAPKTVIPVLQQFIAEQNYSLPPDSPILDAGCGTGLIGAALQQAGFKNLSGCDISSKSLLEAQKKAIYHQLKPGNLLATLPFANTQFDAIFCIGVLSRFDKNQILAILQEFTRLVRDGGLIVFSHRSDLIEKTDLLTALSQEDCFSTPWFTAPQDYLPNLEGYAGIAVQYVILQKLTV
ncbi:MAG: methyltransferase domain-containing protein [Jaaginema sp. PMC 1079.18]|nr:methyltransferase domain-containing protein [Jaaginema sp. PMC 1080.18]MEC4853360.1 methyltransferase domain-containing protein [Jaaginema sp. PMC 1079.18]MEC4865376.1 methyltransferase domain-containing protein [Jaaginema sp. PMC 1078.18]